MNIAMYQIVVLALATAAVSVTVSKGRIFSSVREWIYERNEWLGKLVSCSYCTSHWVAIALVAIYRPVLVQHWYVFDFLVSVFTLVAIAAIISGVIIKLTPFKQSSPTAEAEEEIDQLRGALQTARDKIVEQSQTIQELQR